VINVSEIVKVYDVEPIQVHGDEDFRFRLEISRNIDGQEFAGKVYRLETYRLQPTFPQSEGKPSGAKSDVLIFVVDEMIDSTLLRGNSVQNVLLKFKAELTKIFGNISSQA
jgi:hypothetical protein